MPKRFFPIWLFPVLWHWPVGLSLVSIYWLGCRWAGHSFSLAYAIFLFGAGAAGYTWMRLYHLRQQRPTVRRFYRKYFIITLLFAIIFSAIALMMLFQSPIHYRLLLVPALFSLFYNLKTGNKWLSWREWGAIKIFIVALVWAALTVYIPAGGRGKYTLPLTAMVAIWVLMLIIPFDIRDLSLDDESLKTLPRIFKQKTLTAGWILYFLFLLLLWAIPYGNCMRILLAGGGLLSLLAIYGASYYDDRFLYTALGVESIPVLTALAAWLICR